jgi:glucose/arabinose dehydrogenase
MARRSLLLAATLLGACAPKAVEAQAGEAPAEAAAVAEAPLPDAPVPTGPPNAPAQVPAFEGQTRAPERKSGVTLAAKTIASGLDHPFAVEILPDGDLLVTEKKSGVMRIITPEGAKGAPLKGVFPVDTRSQGGLLDVALSPDFATDRMVYWTFAEPQNGKAGTSLARARLSADETTLENPAVIFRQSPAWGSRGPYGSRIAFAPDGALFLAMGERQAADVRVLAQDPKTHIGKVVRLNADGTARAGNPYTDGSEGAPEVWSLGHRNIQGAAIDANGDLWTLEHGPQGGDELNRPEAGKNYGWPIITYGEDYGGGPIGDGVTAKAGMEQPVYFFDPVIAPGGMAFYDNPAIGEWTGDLVIASLQVGLVRLDIENGRVTGEERFDLGLGRLRDIAIAPDGAMWVVTDHGDGELIRIARE